MPGSLLNPKTGRVESVKWRGQQDGRSAPEEAIAELFPTLPALPKAPDLGPRFRPTPYEHESLDDAMARMDAPMDFPPAPSSAPAAPSRPPQGSGFTVNGPTSKTPEGYADWAAERENFLARGSSPEIGQMADALEVRADIDRNTVSGQRPDLLAAERARLAIGGLRNARQRESQQLDPAFARENAALDDISDAETFMHPRVMGQRQQQRREGLDQARDLQDLDIEGKTDPRVLGLLFQQWMQQQRLAGINASGRNPFAGILGGDAQPGQAPAQGADVPQKRTRSGQIAKWDGSRWYVDE